MLYTVYAANNCTTAANKPVLNTVNFGCNDIHQGKKKKVSLYLKYRSSPLNMSPDDT